MLLKVRRNVVIYIFNNYGKKILLKIRRNVIIGDIVKSVTTLGLIFFIETFLRKM